MPHPIPLARRILVLLLPLSVGGLPLALPAQQRENFPGVRLGLIYEARTQPTLAIKPFTSRFGGGGLERQVEAIIGRDLRYSDRFNVLDSLPAALLGEGVDYRLWDQIGATWLLTGQVEGMGQGYVLVLTLHDVVYAEEKARERFPIPDPSSPDFRMAVHRASDRVVEWIFNEPGIAATRIAFSMRLPSGAQEIYLVDSDGENLRRLTNFGTITMSPAWHPSGEKLAYNSFREDRDGFPRIYEMDLRTGRERMLNPGRAGQQMTPAYHPNGREIAFALVGGERKGIFSYDWERNCCLTQVQGGRWEDLSPSFSPDGNWLAFQSNRLGTASPQIYVMDLRGGEPFLVSPYVYGPTAGHYAAPDWSPRGDRIAFHGRLNRNANHQILVAEVGARGTSLLQLTAEGNNEDPSWAPDGRHLVFAGERSWGYGLFVVDAVTGKIRLLVPNARARIPAWSPSLGDVVGARLGVGGPSR